MALCVQEIIMLVSGNLRTGSNAFITLSDMIRGHDQIQVKPQSLL